MNDCQSGMPGAWNEAIHSRAAAHATEGGGGGGGKNHTGRQGEDGEEHTERGGVGEKRKQIWKSKKTPDRQHAGRVGEGTCAGKAYRPHGADASRPLSLPSLPSPEGCPLGSGARRRPDAGRQGGGVVVGEERRKVGASVQRQDLGGRRGGARRKEVNGLARGLRCAGAVG